MIIINGNDLTLEQVVGVARFGSRVALSAGAADNMRSSREKIDKMLSSGRPIYGVNTGFGDLLNVSIKEDQILDLQKNLIRSHSSGFGKQVEEETVRAMILVRANALTKGYSGVRVELVQSLIELLNLDIYPYVPESGSVGSSGDLSPLSHLASVLIGEGKVVLDGRIVDSSELFREKGFKPVILGPKEGISLINGTSYMLANLALSYYDARNLFKHSILSSAMAMHVLSATNDALNDGLFIARPYKEQKLVAENLSRILKESSNIEKGSKEKVQDAYSLRCVPTVLGSVLQTLNFVRDVLNVELNSATDNPLVFDSVISGCNFHGEPLALASDYLSIAFGELGNMTERRVFRMLDSSLSGMKPFLAENPGVESGLMVPQYVAAALCNENKVLAYPSSVDNITTSANQEDHNSMGATSVRKLRKIIGNVGGILAIEIMTSYKAMNMYGVSGRFLPDVNSKLKGVIGEMKGDIETTSIIQRITKMIDSGDLLTILPIKLS